MKKRLGLMDSVFVMNESTDTPQHMAGLVIIKKPPRSGTNYLKGLFQHLRGFPVNSFPSNVRLTPGLKGKLLPSLESLAPDDIDIDYHFRHTALPHPGGQLELGQVVSRLLTHPLDMRRPLWEIHLIEGLKGNKFALFCKLHHALADGTSGLSMMTSWLSETSAGEMVPPWYIPEDVDTESSGSRASGKFSSNEPLLVRLKKTAVRTMGSVAQVQRDALKAANKLILDPGQMERPFGAPRTALNARITGRRRIATQELPFARIRKLSKTLDVSVNDIILAIIGDAMRHYITEVDQLPEKSLLATNLVNVRKEGGEDKAGNVIGFIQANLATDITDPIERVSRVHASTQSAKAYIKELSAFSAMLFSSSPQIPESLMFGLGLKHSLSPSQNIFVSNLPGFKNPLYFGDCSVEGMFLPTVLNHGNPLLITLMTYVDKICVTVVACPDVALSPQNLALYLPEALARLESSCEALSTE